MICLMNPGKIHNDPEEPNCERKEGLQCFQCLCFIGLQCGMPGVTHQCSEPCETSRFTSQRLKKEAIRKGKERQANKHQLSC